MVLDQDFWDIQEASWSVTLKCNIENPLLWMTFETGGIPRFQKIHGIGFRISTSFFHVCID